MNLGMMKSMKSLLPNDPPEDDGGTEEEEELEDGIDN